MFFTKIRIWRVANLFPTNKTPIRLSRRASEFAVNNTPTLITEIMVNGVSKSFIATKTFCWQVILFLSPSVFHLVSFLPPPFRNSRSVHLLRCILLYIIYKKSKKLLYFSEVFCSNSVCQI